MHNRRLVRVGKVISDKMDKTIIVEVERQFRHPLYKKIVRSHKNIAAHDEQNQCQIDDVVKVSESRPISKTKKWVVDKIIKKRK